MGVIGERGLAVAPTVPRLDLDLEASRKVALSLESEDGLEGRDNDGELRKSIDSPLGTVDRGPLDGVLLGSSVMVTKVSIKRD